MLRWHCPEFARNAEDGVGDDVQVRVAAQLKKQNARDREPKSVLDLVRFLQQLEDGMRVDDLDEVARHRRRFHDADRRLARRIAEKKRLARARDFARAPEFAL